MARQKATHIDTADAVGRRLREAREARGLLQRDLAFDGCTAGYVSRIESGARIPSLQLIQKFARRLGVTTDYLAYGENISSEAAELADAQLAQRLGERESARSVYERLSSSAEPATRKAALLGLGQLTLQNGSVEKAIDLLTEYEVLSEHDRPINPAAAEALAHAYSTQGDIAAILALIERKLELAGDDHFVRFRLSVILANALIDLGDLDRAETIIGESIADLGTTRDPIALARCLWSQSRLQTARGHSDLAYAYAREALSLINVTEHEEYAARAHQLLAFIELERGNAARALELLDEAMPLVSRGHDETLYAVFQLERARALAALGEFDEARSLASGLLPQIERLSPVDAARSLGILADVLAKTGDIDRALDLYEAAADELAGRERVPMLVGLYRCWSDLLAETGQTEKALEIARRALQARESAPAR